MPVGRKVKLTTDEGDRKDQRERTEALITSTKGMGELQSTPPRYLKGVAYAAWTELQPMLAASGLVKQADKSILVSLCEQLAVQRKAYESVMADGIVLNNGRKNPAAQVFDTSTAKVKTLCDALGLNPQSRASLMNVTPDDSAETRQSVSDALKDNGDDKW